METITLRTTIVIMKESECAIWKETFYQTKLEIYFNGKTEAGGYLKRTDGVVMKEKKTKIYLLLILTLLLVSLTGCSENDQGQEGDGTAGAYTWITHDEAAEMMTQDDGHIIVDVRTQAEYDEGHIPGAICIPNETISDVQPEELPDFEQVILVYCRSGNRSSQAAQKLADIGYKNVYDFGGITTWSGEIVTGG